MGLQLAKFVTEPQHESKTRNPIKGHKGQHYTAIAMFMVLVNLQKILLKKLQAIYIDSNSLK